MIDFLIDQFKNNEFFTAAVLAAPAAMVTYSMRAVPRAVWTSFKKLVSVEVRFNSDMTDYYKVQDYLTANVVWQNLSRNFTYHYDDGFHPAHMGRRKKSYVAVGYGTHLGTWNGRPAMVRRFQVEGSNTDRFKEATEVILLGRGSRTAASFLEKVDEHMRSASDGKYINLYANTHDHWSRIGKVSLRSLETVLTEENAGHRILASLRDFVASEKWFLQRGLPYHTGVLLTGLPGTGKSSLIQALASEMKRDIYYLNLGSVERESQLAEVMSSCSDWRKAILVLEDLDVSGASVDRESESPKITLSYLLNFLDGILSPPGMIVMATTNNPDSLDPALVRPGRFDLVAELKPLDFENFKKLAKIFEMDGEEVQELRLFYRPETGAKLRALLVQGPQAVRQHFGL